MKCYVHQAADANGTCKFCCKGVCSSCAKDCGYGLCCSDSCGSELASIQDIMNKSKMLYGQKRGRLPILPLMFIPMGLVIGVQGFYALQAGRGYTGIVMGGIFIALGILALINQKRTGIRS